MTEINSASNFDQSAHANMVRERLEADAARTAEYKAAAKIESASIDAALTRNRDRLLALPPSQFTSKVSAELISDRIQRGLRQIPFPQDIPCAQPLLDKIELLKNEIPEDVAADVPNSIVEDAQAAWQELEPLGQAQRQAHSESVTARLHADSRRAAEYNSTATAQMRRTDRALRHNRVRLLSQELRSIPKITDLKNAPQHLEQLRRYAEEPLNHQTLADTEAALNALEETRWTRTPRHPLSPWRLLGSTDMPAKKA